MQINAITRSLFIVMTWCGLTATATAVTVDFEDLPLAPGSFYNGADGAGGFTSRGAHFNNLFDGIAVGWAYSNTTDTTTPGPTNQYSSFAGGGAGGSENYGVVFFDVTVDFPEDSLITLPDGLEPVSVRISNTTYAATSMQQGDQFAKPFGGASGDDADYLKLTIIGLDASGDEVAEVESFLADYRFADSAQDYILGGWRDVDLTALRERQVVGLTFLLESTDTHPTYGMNTPAYFAMDDLVLAPPGPPDTVPGDLNGDGAVTRADAALMIRALGTTFDATLADGDLDGDGAVGLTDLSLLRGKLTNPAAARVATVPEPSGGLLIALALLLFLPHAARTTRTASFLHKEYV